MHSIAKALPEYEHYFTPLYTDGIMEVLRKKGMIDYTVAAGKMFKSTMDYLRNNRLEVDYRGEQHSYDLVVRSTDIIIPKNTKYVKSILVQEGMTDPRNIRYYLIKYLRALPRWMTSTATAGMSNNFEKFCVASEGYKEHFLENQVKPEKLVVTGIPNFDDCQRYYNNNFPHMGYVLVCTSDMRETKRIENRKKFILDSVEKAAGKQLVFKLHPNENVERATKEINQYAPGALVYSEGNAGEMIANCDILITRYSSVVLVAAALGKTIYSDLDTDTLKRLTPLQNGNSAYLIANVCREMLEGQHVFSPHTRGIKRRKPAKYFAQLAEAIRAKKALKTKKKVLV